MASCGAALLPNDYLRNLWMSFLVPTNSSLIGLSKDQLRHKRVCEKHFDRYQFDEEGKRLRHSYPCLFKDDEIAHGVPLSSSETVQNALSDHNNYHKVESDENENVADNNMLVIGRAGDDYHEHPSCIPAIPVVMKRPTDNIHTGSSSSMATTAEVVEFFDELFDSVNCYPGGATKGKMRKAVKINSPHIQFWTEAIKKLKEIKFEDTSSKIALQSGKPRLVRVPSVDGWITTLESFIRITKILFEKYAVKYYYPRNINQDPLENFFGRVRALNYRNINPDANTFIYSFKSLLFSNLLSPHSKFANCEVDNGDTLIDTNFLFEDNNDENKQTLNYVSTPSTSQETQVSAFRGSIQNENVILEKVKVQCSAYTAGYICRKMTKSVNNCKNCMKSFTSKSTEDNIYSYMRQREYYKLLKNSNLVYPSSKLLVLYREASCLVHNYLNDNCIQNEIGANLREKIQDLEFSWLGCQKTHNMCLKKMFLTYIVRLHVHNWSNIINKILKGAIEERYVQKMAGIHKIAFMKYKTNKLRKRALNK
ncbi:uncharacterized protein LOC123701039 [Colias croceus]|uniref:uncharacterized protein LOC123701039 n=1 Tax=Colias crocea TaxID=72248 RepID=UPI001E27BA7C|nr:uncharacterized protein LOC123701039 [Colias croceus]